MQHLQFAVVLVNLTSTYDRAAAAATTDDCLIRCAAQLMKGNI